MKRSGNTISYTADEIREMIARGDDRTDWVAVDAMTEEDVEAAIADDPDEANIVWSGKWVKGSPPPKAAISIRLDPDVLAFFKKGGRGYQTKINAVLRQYMEAMQQK